MHRDDLVEGIAGEFKLSKAESRRIFDTIFDTIIDDAIAGKETSIPGFGKFKTVVRAARAYKNPLAGSGTVPEKRAIVFRPSSTLKDRIR
jgi:DNA-binding protein HU-beta